MGVIKGDIRTVPCHEPRGPEMRIAIDGPGTQNAAQISAMPQKEPTNTSTRTIWGFRAEGI